ncbi:MAG: formate dehydrogenase accessory sulfurtransferase FdhD [Desulfobacter sp.]
MNTEHPFGEFVSQPITRYRTGELTPEESPVAVEVPLTFVVNGHETATLLCTPSHLDAYVYGFLFTSGMISSVDDIQDVDIDEKKWRADIRVKEFLDPELLGQRVYTSGCGKGVMFTSVVELASRHPVENDVRISGRAIIDAMGWLAKCSDLHKKTGGVHSAAVSINGRMPEFHIDDIGRHNAVDKVIGTLLMNGTDTGRLVLLSTGRISSEILHKARRLSIPVLASRGAPTHQSVLLAREMGVTIVGFVRPTNFAVFTHPERITAP